MRWETNRILPFSKCSDIFHLAIISKRKQYNGLTSFLRMSWEFPKTEYLLPSLPAMTRYPSIRSHTTPGLSLSRRIRSGKDQERTMFGGRLVRKDRVERQT